MDHYVCVSIKAILRNIPGYTLLFLKKEKLTFVKLKTLT